MHTDSHDGIADDPNPAPATPARHHGIACFRCDEHPGNPYEAKILFPVGRPAERAARMRDALLGGAIRPLCPPCAGVLASFGRALGWHLEPVAAYRLPDPPPASESRTPLRVASPTLLKTYARPLTSDDDTFADRMREVFA